MMKPLHGIPTLSDDIIARPRYEPDKRATLDEATVLTRYLTHSKYVDMVGTQSIYFSRLVRLRDGDPDEGRVATSHYLADARFREADGTNAPDQRALYREFLEQGPHQQAYVSCWYIGEAESERMWHEYVPAGEGVAVQTTVGRLLQHFNGDGGIKTVTLAPIAYVDYNEATMAGIEERDDTLAALKYKGTSWIHESEMRAILLYNMFYIYPQIPKYGERLSVSLGDFVTRLFLAPNATPEYEQKARDVVSETSVVKLFRRSAL
jgi:hypothetical protein